MSALNAARKLASGNLVTPRGRMLYPALFTPQMPRGETDKEKAAYQVSLLIPKGSDVKALQDAVEEAIAEKLTPAIRAKIGDAARHLGAQRLRQWL